MAEPHTQKPLSETAQRAEKNLKRFILFRVFFNARFYYPVFTIIFLDYGLTLEQFSILNLVWAITIVLAEVPSGAMADIVGRRNLVVLAAALMVVEMALLTFVPIGPSTLLFIFFLINRISSGLAEAAASGADEALAYDSLKYLGRENDWALLLERVTRYTSIGFFTTMILGAAVYDRNVLNSFLGWFGWEATAQVALRLPIILTLLTSFIVLFAALGLKEINPSGESSPAAKTKGKSISERLAKPFAQIADAAKWTLNHRFVLFVIIAGLALDSVARQLIVLGSEYYRTIDIPTAGFGIIGAVMALLGVVWARIGRILVNRFSPLSNFILLSSILIIGLIGVAFTIPKFGVVFAIMVFSMMGFVSYFSSYYINLHVDSDKRATVLSFRGLAFNLGLGIASLLYTALISALKVSSQSTHPEALQKEVFVDALSWFPGYFFILFILILIAGKIFIRRSSLCTQVPSQTPILK